MLKKDFEKRILAERIVDTKAYRYIVTDCHDSTHQWQEIRRLPISKLDTTAALTDWETVKSYDDKKGEETMIIRLDETDIFRTEIDLTIGTEYVLVERTNVNTGARWHELREHHKGGIPGNMDHTIRRYHGWRGTTNDISTDAMGLRRIEAVTKYKNGNVKITLSEDLLPNEP